MNRNKPPYALIVFCILAIISVGGASWIKHDNITRDDLLCPSQYATDEEATAAMQVFINDFFDAHPDASLTDMANARHDFYVSNHCTQELAAYQQAQEGTADPTTMKTIDKAIEQTLQSKER